MRLGPRAARQRAMGAASSVPAASKLSEETLKALEALPDDAKKELLEKAKVLSPTPTKQAALVFSTHAITVELATWAAERHSDRSSVRSALAQSSLFGAFCGGWHQGYGARSVGTLHDVYVT